MSREETADAIRKFRIYAKAIDPAQAAKRREEAAKKLAEAIANTKKTFDLRLAVDKTVDPYLDWRRLKRFDPPPACINRPLKKWLASGISLCFRRHRVNFRCDPGFPLRTDPA